MGNPRRCWNSSAFYLVRAPSRLPLGVVAGSGRGTWEVGLRAQHLQSAHTGKKSYYAPYRLLSTVHIFAVLKRGTLEFGPRALAVCCERRALWGAWWLVFGRRGHAVKPRRRGQLGPVRISVCYGTFPGHPNCFC